MSAEPMTMAAYSPMKNIANFIEEYSVWYPPTSSVSHSGRSKGMRFVSAKIEMVKIRKAMKAGIQNIAV